MKATKRIFGLILVLIMLMGAAFAEVQLVPTVSNAEVPVNPVQNMVVTGPNTFDVTVYDTTGNTDINNVSVSIDGKELNASSFTAGTSWVFLVDTSTVSTQSGRAPITKTLKDLISGMGVNDNGLVCNPSTMTSTRTLASKADLESMSNAALMETNASNPASLSSAITASLNYLGSNAAAKQHTVLVIISNGNPSGETESSLNSLAPQIQKVGTTIYSVAYTRSSLNQNVLQAYLGLGKSSKGGKGIQQADSGKDKAAEEVVKGVLGNEIYFKTISVEIPAGVQLTSANNLTVTIRGLAPATFTYAIPKDVASRLPVSAVVEEESSWLEENLKLVIIIGAAALIVIAGLVVILVVTHKKKKDIVEVDDVPPPPPVSREVRITLTREEDGEQFSAVTQGGVCVVGRSTEVDVPLPDPKMKISREHMQLSYENGILMLADLGSRNHTFVNGIMVNRKTVMQQGDIIRMGDSEFRISWRQL